ncbi:MAG TPA: hypothetical protein ENK05_06560 [Gammaproteobacteria bacterium]|nr:hypothetical protein [Gammaproteobacteria bacterium]
MIEYVFFHRQPLELFLRFVEEQGVGAQTREFEDRMEVLVPDELDEALSDRIDERYDELMEMEGDLTDAEQAGEAGEFQGAGIVVNLKDGTTVYANLDSRLLARVMTVIEPREFAVIVDAIVEAVENRVDRPACQRGESS